MTKSIVLALAAFTACASAGRTVEFGLYDAQLQPGGGWTLATASQLLQYQSEFVRSYNLEGGIKPIKTFQSANCCIAVKGGLKLTISGTKYKFQFPAGQDGKIACNPKGGYSANQAWAFFLTPKLSADHIFGAKEACVNNHNPGVFIKLPHVEDRPDAIIASKNTMEFGLYRLGASPGSGWRLLTSADLLSYGKQFAASYNALKGINVVKPFKSNNCCIAMANGMKLSIQGTKYGHLFPASLKGGIRCNPALGYSEGRYKFYKVDAIPYGVTMSSTSACATDANPAIFIRPKNSSELDFEAGSGYEYIQFGLYDAQSKPPGAWELVTEKDLVAHKRALVHSYNRNGGFNLIAKFQSVNCCVAIANGKKLAISGTKYTMQFLGDAEDDEIRCNPDGGYTASRYRFFKVPTLSVSQAFSAKEACKTDHNPALYKMMTRVEVQPTPPPTPPPTTTTSAPVTHCKVSPWGAFNACSKTCGHGVRTRTRQVITRASGGGIDCPGLSQVRDCIIQQCPLACKVGKWTVWGACSAVCGGGTQKRTRPILQPPVANGAACPMRIHSRRCNEEPCPVHCDVSPWSSYTHCSKSCGGGIRERRRIVTIQPAFEGNGCPELVERQDCNTQDCIEQTTAAPTPTDCKVTNWGAWEPCSATCGPGKQRRTRHVSKQAEHGGFDCPPLVDLSECMGAPCPVNCKMDAWHSWGACSLTCGTGYRERTRAVLRHAHYGGTECPSKLEIEPCNAEPCAVDCVMSDWTWEPCSVTCGGGTQDGFRSVAREADYGGKGCPSSSKSRKCSPDKCPVDCAVGAWGQWSTCDKTCGGGRLTRSRKVVNVHAYGGTCNDPLVEHKPCNDQSCPVDCKMDDWSGWSPCSETCGNGIQSRSRKVLSQPKHGGIGCGVIEETRTCYNPGCSVDCKMSTWGAWSACSRTCGKGTRSHERSIAVAAQYGGLGCGPKYEMVSCNANPCPVDCILSGWRTTTPCSVSCGTGVEKRVRNVIRPGQHGGEACSTEQLRNVPCNLGSCPVNCNVSGWGKWSKCTRTCDGGMKTRTRTVTQKAQTGSTCPSLIESAPCGNTNCPIDCTLSSWGAYSPCSKTCGGGYQKRRRTVTRLPNWNGEQCDYLQEHRECNSAPCPINCLLTQWSSWSPCNKECGSGKKSRTRSKVNGPSHGGSACGALKETVVCNQRACPADCVMNDWGSWGQCTHTCGGGRHHRARSVQTLPRAGGAPCPVLLFEAELCNDFECPVDCKLGAWHQWGGCSATCGGGTRTRSRQIERAALHAGKPCDATHEEGTCGKKPCPIDCIAGNWNNWSTCTKTCAGGTRFRTRPIVTAATWEGKACGSTHQVARCNSGKCPIKCQMRNWSGWDVCTKTCGGGVTRRTRSILRRAAYGASECPNDEEEQPCHDDPCPVDCQVTKYGEWSACTETCGGGSRSRSRKVKSWPSSGGKSCPSLMETISCESQPCPVDCRLASWSTWSQCAVTCGGGMQTRNRGADVEAFFGGAACAHRYEARACNEAPCPADCLVGHWQPYGPCDKTCGPGGKMHAVRYVTRAAENGGKACPATSRSASCAVNPCPIDCVEDKWGSFSPCTNTCGTNGLQFRTRGVIVKPMYGGKACKALRQTVPCNRTPCPVHCEMNAWGSFGACTHTCGPLGLMTRSRTVKVAAMHNGDVCPAKLNIRSCNNDACPVDCELASWSSWSQCSHTCNGGSRTRSRKIATQPAYGGAQCGAGRQSETCNDHECPINCELSDWIPVTGCSKTCGGGSRTLHQSVNVEGAHGGAECPSLSERTKAEKCNSAECPIDCKLTQWSSWGKCSRTCGTGVKARTRVVEVTPQHGGKACDNPSVMGVYANIAHYNPLEETKPCGTSPCPVDCRLADVFWSQCDVSCGGGTRVGKRSVLVYPKHGGKTCESMGGTTVKEVCNPDACPLDCEMNSWGEWSTCTASCSGGDKTRTRTVKKHPQHGGSVCPSIEEKARCHAFACPTNCVLGPWGAFTKCTRTCGTGTKYRRRPITSHARYGGSCNNPTAERINCNTTPCPVDCVWGEWGAWSSCTASCQTASNQGTRTRSRSELTVAKHQGAKCAATDAVQTGPCERNPCPVHCTVSDWGGWGSCTALCGGGEKVRRRVIKTHALHNGYECPSLLDKSRCNTQLCPTDCVLGTWGPWSVCSNGGAVCGPGSRTRSRSVQQKATNGGAACPDQVSQEDTCNLGACTTTAPPTTTEVPTTTTTTPLSEFEVRIEAEDGTTRLSGGATFDNEFTGYTGDGYVDFGDKAGETVTWRIDVPVSGRYELRWRYALSGQSIAPLRYKHEHVSINHKFSSDVNFNPTATGSWSVWSIQSDVVELTAGINFVTLETTDASGPHVDSLTVNYIATMRSCTPGETVPLKWFAHAAQKSQIYSNGGYATLGNAISGSLSGSIDLGAVGPWDIKFTVADGEKKQPTDTLSMRINGKDMGTTHEAIKSSKGFHFETRSGHVSYTFDWESLGSNFANHIRLLDGTATCAGCTHVRCRYVEHKASASKRLVVYHHAAEMKGKKHQCGWHASHNTCLCQCGDKLPPTPPPTPPQVLTHGQTNPPPTQKRVNNIVVTTPAPAGVQCTVADWFSTMNAFAPNDSPWLDRQTEGWNRCVDNVGRLQRGGFLTGLYKGECDNDSLGCIEQASCCDTAESRVNAKDLQCYNADWKQSMTAKGWSMCDNGYFLTGLRRGQCTDLHCLETASCCKMPQTESWQHCYSTEAWAEGNSKSGWRQCNEGYFLAGVYRNDVNDINGLEKLKCCK